MKTLDEAVERVARVFDPTEINPSHVIRIAKEVLTAINYPALAEVVAAAEELQFGAYPAHGSGLIIRLTAGDPSRLAQAVAKLEGEDHG